MEGQRPQSQSFQLRYTTHRENVYYVCDVNAVLFVFQVEEGEPNVMWLSGLHIPESYLTALVQATCRKNGWPLDRSTLYTQVTQYRSEEEVTEKPGQGEAFHSDQ